MEPTLMVPDTNLVQINPIWVEDPRSKKLVNVRPFLDALNDFEAQIDSPLSEGCAEAVHRVIRAMCLTVHDHVTITPMEQANMYHDLFRLWDMFMATGACNKPDRSTSGVH